jgi:hypothetical protein
MWRTWADVLAERAVEAGKPAPPQALPVDRFRGEGPPRCCGRRRIAADMLVWYGGLGATLLGRVRSRFEHLADVPDADLYLCDGCRETLRRNRVLLRTEMPASRPLALPEAV